MSNLAKCQQIPPSKHIQTLLRRVMDTFYRWNLSSRQESLMQVSEKLFNRAAATTTLCPGIIRRDGYILDMYYISKQRFFKEGPSCSFWLGFVFTFMKCWHWAGCDWGVRELMPTLLSHPVWAQGQGRVFPQNAQETPRIYPRDTQGFHLSVSFLTRLSPGSQSI